MAILVNYLKKNNRKETKRERGTLFFYDSSFFYELPNEMYGTHHLFILFLFFILSPLFFFLWSQAPIG